jgi:hypothetical protein
VGAGVGGEIPGGFIGKLGGFIGKLRGFGGHFEDILRVLRGFEVFFEVF